MFFSKKNHIFAILKQDIMKKNIGLIFVGILLIFSLFSCSDPTDYQIQIVNNTPYRIDKLEFGGSVWRSFDCLPDLIRELEIERDS